MMVFYLKNNRMNSLIAIFFLSFLYQPDDHSSVLDDCSSPMSQQIFSYTMRIISQKSFEQEKLSFAQSQVKNHCISTEQIVKLMKVFEHESTRLTFAKFAYGFTSDQENFTNVKNGFEYELSKADLQDFIESQ